MVIVVPSTVTVPLSLVTTVVPLKVIVVVELFESLSSDSVVVVSVAESEELLVNTEAVSDAVTPVVLELVLELVFSSALFVSDAEVSLVVLSAVSEELASGVAEVLDCSDVSLLVDVAAVSSVVLVVDESVSEVTVVEAVVEVLVAVSVLVSEVADVLSVCVLSSIKSAVVSPVETVESVDSVFASSAEALLSFRTTELPKIKLATRTEPAVFHFDDFLMA